MWGEPEAWCAAATDLVRFLGGRLRGLGSACSVALEPLEGGAVLAESGEAELNAAAAALAPTLEGTGTVLCLLEGRLRRLGEEFSCLDDGEAEALFGTHGSLADAAAEASESAHLCAFVASETQARGRSLVAAR